MRVQTPLWRIKRSGEVLFIQEMKILIDFRFVVIFSCEGRRAQYLRTYLLRVHAPFIVASLPMHIGYVISQRGLL